MAKHVVTVAKAHIIEKRISKLADDCRARIHSKKYVKFEPSYGDKISTIEEAAEIAQVELSGAVREYRSLLEVKFYVRGMIRKANMNNEAHARIVTLNHTNEEIALLKTLKSEENTTHLNKAVEKIQKAFRVAEELETMAEKIDHIGNQAIRAVAIKTEDFAVIDEEIKRLEKYRDQLNDEIAELNHKTFVELEIPDYIEI